MGTRLRIRETVGGIPGEETGEITQVFPQSSVTWEAPQAHYRWCGVTVTVGEGVTWSLDPSGDGATLLGVHVWATRPAGKLGRLLGWVFVHLLRGVAKDREHARIELRYLKCRVETGAAPGNVTAP
ncbi:hypothetical protein [Glycomyces tenuis]|uniref:hypothetical protein n=1 Tax=Glycomyces tenuis TaxID=58116 RepID=UPI00047C1AB5|nr:hypothetical protein [Glycomyces tenuis]